MGKAEVVEDTNVPLVAVARASGADPELLNATDTDWWHYREALKENGVNVVFLCPELMER